MDLLADDPVPFETGFQIPMKRNHRLSKFQGATKADWRVEPVRRDLVMRDSNADLPIPDRRVQVDSFPGATLHHAAAIIRALQEPRRVVLAFGLSDRATSTRDTFRRNLRRLMDEAETKFPQALVFAPQIPYSSLLPQQDR